MSMMSPPCGGVIAAIEGANSMDERGMDEVMEFHIALVKDTPKAQQAALDAFAAGGWELTHTEKATSILHTNMYFRRPKSPGQPRPPDLTPVMSDSVG
jgi:hypothetical protein